jgi:DNA ligase-associated metallophosphoesterase
MITTNSAQTRITDWVILDGRLALFHEEQRWLAIADLHFGFELSQRAAGNLFPLWGMRTIQQRVEELVADYEPAHLVVLGDLVHDGTGGRVLAEWVRELEAATQVILISGNHDRHLRKQIETVPSWRSDGFCFHHGHCEMDAADEIQIIGHHHPAQVVRDGAGLRLKLPAFVKQTHCWIMPAFSPWAAGAIWPQEEETRIWLCSPTRIFAMAPAG